MIQQIYLSKSSGREQLQRCFGRGTPDFDKPMELLMNVEDYPQFEKTIRLLFDKKSVEAIKRSKNAVRM